MSHTVIEPRTSGPDAQAGSRWMVLIYDNDYTLVDQVILVLLQATHCSLSEAQIEVWEAQEYGKAPVHFASRDECEKVAATISSIGVRAEVVPEWED